MMKSDKNIKEAYDFYTRNRIIYPVLSPGLKYDFCFKDNPRVSDTWIYMASANTIEEIIYSGVCVESKYGWVIVESSTGLIVKEE